MSNGSEPPASSAFQRRSLPVLVRLAALPRWALVAAVAVVLVAGLWAPGWAGAALLLVLAGFLGWLLALGWARLTPATAGLRLLVVAMLVWAASQKVL